MIIESRRNRLTSPWTFFALVFSWCWGFWGVAIALDASITTPLGFILFIVGGLGILILGLLFSYLTKSKAEFRDYLISIVDPRRIRLKWLAIILLFVPALHAVAALIDVALGGTGATLGSSLANSATDPFRLGLSAMFATIVPFIEEPGWRGYALARLQKRHSALVASLILGVVWSLWHFPLFFIPGSFQAEQGAWTLDFWLLMIGIVPLTFAFTWIYNNTGGSILAVVLFHGMINFTGELLELSPRADLLTYALWVLVAVVIVRFWGTSTFVRTMSPTPAQ
jgi:membrane protease YdiL (CAAX protease family)